MRMLHGAALKITNHGGFKNHNLLIDKNLLLQKLPGSMPNDIKCPNCGHSFPMEEAVAEEYKKDLRAQMQKFIGDKEKEFQKKADQQEALFSTKLDDERR